MLRRKNMTAVIVSGILGVLGAGAPAYGDAVTDWNAIALDAVTAGRPVPSAWLMSHWCRSQCTMRRGPRTARRAGTTWKLQERKVGVRLLWPPWTPCTGGHVSEPVDEFYALYFNDPADHAQRRHPVLVARRW